MKKTVYLQLPENEINMMSARTVQLIGLFEWFILYSRTATLNAESERTTNDLTTRIIYVELLKDYIVFKCQRKVSE